MRPSGTPGPRNVCCWKTALRLLKRPKTGPEVDLSLAPASRAVPKRCVLLDLAPGRVRDMKGEAEASERWHHGSDVLEPQFVHASKKLAL